VSLLLDLAREWLEWRETSFDSKWQLILAQSRIPKTVWDIKFKDWIDRVGLG
jgi:hypothetical protein